MNYFNQSLTCPVCSSNWITDFKLGNNLKVKLVKCLQCSLVFQSYLNNPIVYNHEYYDFWDLNSMFKEVRAMKIKTAKAHLQILRNQLMIDSGNLLDVGCAFGFLLEAARKFGFIAYGVEVSPAANYASKRGLKVFHGNLQDANYDKSTFSVVTMIDSLEHIAQPLQFLECIHDILTQKGAILIVTPNVSSLSRRLLKNRWFHFKTEHLCYYSPLSLHKLLQRTGFSIHYIQRGFKYLSYHYLVNHLMKYNRNNMTQLLNKIINILPHSLTSFPFKFSTEMICIATKVS